MNAELANAQWLKSSYSSNGGQCVEVAADLIASHGIVPIRDSKNPDGPALSLRAHAFAAFVTGVQADGFSSL
ncbi:DUF397 domain-containing protein [Streptomyces sp. JNUCC 64]